ncbi:DUF3857 domain-containing protein [Dinghuibacter silviterrae]|uniref:Uncharacterized protein DUF3857 n=1 Tax=Dinghuibacter silviterrae TaxID=1539049 RepID=A0A4R8DUU5_9BACT|nr:DUF3857 domain-containing protein [Dinghuibacter silviterrae]TDX01688.1 uncharacterized protein DUF3857 [Dinghuibacter silviterrae]
MRKASVLILLLVRSLVTLGQKDIPAYGKIDKDDLTMTTCDFDPEADAVVLIKTGETTFVLNGQPYLQTAYRFRIKILKDKGVEHANIKIHYYSKDRWDEIDNISGETYNLDAAGNIVKSKLDKANIYNKALDKTYSEIAFTLPDVKKGSVIEYKYLKVSKDFGDIDNWYFQYEDMPVRYGQFFISIPYALVFTYHVHRTLPMEEKDETYQEAQKTFTMKNIPALRDEPYMSAPRDYLQNIDFQLSAIREPGEPDHSYRTTWNQLCTELLDDEDFGGQLHKNVPHTKDLDLQLSLLKDSLSRMGAVYDYVKKNMDWNGDMRLYSDGIKSAWDKKTGSTADVNLLLVNLLRDAGLDAHPLLVSTRDHGHTNPYYPLLAQFNETMAYVRIGDENYVMDATDKYTPFWMIPEEVQYTRGMLVDKDAPQWITMVHDQDRYKTIVVLSGDVDSTNKFSGTATISSFGYSRSDRCATLKKGMDHFKDTYFTKAYSSLHVDSLTVEDRDNDSLPLKQTVDFSSELSSSGQYTFLSPNLFLGLEKNPFVAEHRFTDVDFGARRYFMIVGSVSIPDGYTFETLPKNMRMIMQDTSIVMERLMQADGSHINYRISLEFKRPVYFTEEYDDFREFYKKLFATLNEQVVIRKNS